MVVVVGGYTRFFFVKSFEKKNVGMGLVLSGQTPADILHRTADPGVCARGGRTRALGFEDHVSLPVSFALNEH